jgi:hypothetical protein
LLRLSQCSRQMVLVRAGICAVLAVLVVAPLRPADASQDQPTKQDPSQKSDLKHKDEGKVPNSKESQKTLERMIKAGEANKLSPAEVIVETAIIAYGNRNALKTARAAIEEDGTIKLATDQGDVTGDYKMRSIRKDKSWGDLLRNDLSLKPPAPSQRTGAPPDVKYVIAFNGASVWSAQNGQYVNPRPEVEAAFRAQLTHDYTNLLRYKEDGSKIELVGPENVVGIDTNVIDLTMPDGQKTRYWLSAKTYRILHMEYDLKIGDSATAMKFRVSYYPPYKIVQNTLVPGRRVMEQNGKVVQEINVNTCTYSAKIDPEVFQHLQSS